jgi:hypothetical protein
LRTREAKLAAQPREFAKTGDENVGHAGVLAALERLVQRRKIAARPEVILEAFRRRAGIGQQAALAEDDGPGGDRSPDQQQHHELHDQARVQQQFDNRVLADHVLRSSSSAVEEPERARAIERGWRQAEMQDTRCVPRLAREPCA